MFYKNIKLTDSLCLSSYNVRIFINTPQLKGATTPQDTKIVKLIFVSTKVYSGVKIPVNLKSAIRTNKRSFANL